MKFLRSFLPNLTISLNLALLIVFYLDLRNPMMGFLVGAPFLVLAACTCLSSIVTGILLYELPGVDPAILDPRDTYECACQWEEKAKDLAGRFIKNFNKFTGNDLGKSLVAAGPAL